MLGGRDSFLANSTSPRWRDWRRDTARRLNRVKRVKRVPA